MALSGSCALLGRHGFNRSAVKNVYNSWNNSLLRNTPKGIISRCVSQTDMHHIIHEGEPQLRPKKISKAMKAYIQRAKEYEEFILKESREFDVGKRHLANMMGQPAETFTQDDVNAALKYLFPSGLFEPRARPIMDDPKKIFPAKKAAQFDEEGRPFHFLFYTRTPNFYQALYINTWLIIYVNQDLVEHMEQLDKMQDNEIRQGLQPTPENKMDLISSSWLSQDDMEKIFLEPLAERQYNYFIASAQRLADHPYSAVCEDFLMRFRKLRKAEVGGLLQYNDQGRPYVVVSQCRQKTATAEVKLWGDGSGQIKINSKDITYFERIHHREQVRFLSYKKYTNA
ncbi:28S ribosomal protein S9, mitochondrial [Fopius arisanus]|uniref:28S ribosomal protein S9, mitochondrial n=1 Tax=Fopius arisanus TaxID=64838 RepID=A0A9R1TXL2_9HYME|nr:PREDICTED: 28S ribosomal protein S9, mitochondrial [Fopius arisanus]